MPIYVYQCSACGERFDAIQKFSDAPLTECRLCKATGITKALTAPGFALKGSGWYATDFKGGSTAKPTADAKSEDKSESKTESKTENATPAAAPSAPAPAAPVASS